MTESQWPILCVFQHIRWSFGLDHRLSSTHPARLAGPYRDEYNESFIC